MKKIIALVCASITVLSLVACSSKPCEFCGNEGKTKKYTVDGESAYLCESCGALAELGNQMQNLMK